MVYFRSKIEMNFYTVYLFMQLLIVCEKNSYRQDVYRMALKVCARPIFDLCSN